MQRYVVLSLMIIISEHVTTAPPVRLTIDCGSEEAESFDDYDSQTRSAPDFTVDSFCNMIQKMIPKAIKDGRIVLVNGDSDQAGLGNALVPISVAPPSGFVPKFPKLRTPKLKVSRMNVPSLTALERPFSPPRLGASSLRIGSPIVSPTLREDDEEETSAEKMERFKKGVQKMLHVVKVLGQIDQYLSERTRIIIDKLSKTLAE